MATHSSTLAWEILWTEKPGRLVHGVMKSWTRLSEFTFTFHFTALKKEMATHSSILAGRIPGTGEPGGLLSMGSYRVGHDWSDLAAAAAEMWRLRLRNMSDLLVIGTHYEVLWKIVSSSGGFWASLLKVFSNLYLAVNLIPFLWYLKELHNFMVWPLLLALKKWLLLVLNIYLPPVP